MKNDTTFIPLFPETLHTQTENLGPRRSPYLEMPSLPGEHEKSMGMEMKGGGDEKSDIGNIIDNLNSKLSNYIQTNNLEDTYRKFKLEFVQLRRNMPYWYYFLIFPFVHYIIFTMGYTINTKLLLRILGRILLAANLITMIVLRSQVVYVSYN